MLRRSQAGLARCTHRTQHIDDVARMDAAGNADLFIHQARTIGAGACRLSATATTTPAPISALPICFNPSSAPAMTTSPEPSERVRCARSVQGN